MRSSTPATHRRTSIIATLGPASADPAVVGALVAAGTDVFRLNFSHGDHDWHRRAHDLVRAAAAEQHRSVGVLADLGGPKIRVGAIDGGGMELHDGEQVTVTTRVVTGRPGLIPARFARLHDDVHPGARILLDDGRMQLVVDDVRGSEIACTVVDGGLLRSGKGMNVPDVELSIRSLTEKDRYDALFAMDLGVDFLALSFVRRGSDVEELRDLARLAGRSAATPPIVAKVETPQAVAALDDVLAAADALMVARGDLGVELGPETIPDVQRELLERARAAGKPAIVATQMLESMIEQAVPTRAEVSDVATAVLSGADAVMLSGETATGRHPVRAVQTMDRVVRHAESRRTREPAPRPRDGTAACEVARSVAELAQGLGAGVIVVFAPQATMAAAISAARPPAPIVATVADARAGRRIGLLWGVVPQELGEVHPDQQAGVARRLAAALGLTAPGQPILAVAAAGDDVSLTVLAA